MSTQRSSGPPMGYRYTFCWIGVRIFKQRQLLPQYTHTAQTLFCQTRQDAWRPEKEGLAGALGQSWALPVFFNFFNIKK